MDLEDCKRKLAQIENANPIQKEYYSGKRGSAGQPTAQRKE